MRRFFFIVSLLLALIPVHILAQEDEKPIKESELGEWFKDSEKDQFKLYYLEAIRLQGIGNLDSAKVLLNKCIDIDSLAAESQYAISQIYEREGNDSIALVHLKKAVATDSQNDEFAESLAQYYLTHNQIDEANEVYEKLFTMCPDRVEFLEILSKTYQYQKNYEKLLSTLNRIEVLEGVNEDLTLSKMQVYSLMGDDKLAHQELTKLVESHPNDLGYKVMKGNWLLSNGKKEEALQTFLEVLKEEPSNAQAQMSLMDYYRMQGNNDAADTLLYEMLENPNTEASTRIALMRQAVGDNEAAGGDSSHIYKIFRRVLSLPQKTSEMAEMQLAYMTLKSAPRDSINAAIRRVLEINPEHIAARLQLIQNMWEDTIDQNFIRECEKALDYVPDEPALYYFLGLAHYTHDNEKETLRVMQNGVKKITPETSKQVASHMYMVIGDIMHKQKHEAEAYAAYDSSLVFEEDNVATLNNYAYYLSLEERELKKAEQMSKKTITAEPQNATYLDTYAWILYKLQRYEEARIYIDQVIKIDSTDAHADVLEHAGDIYIKLGEKEKAVDMWQQALNKNSENANIIRKKIKKAK